LQPQIYALAGNNAGGPMFDWNDLRYFLAVARCGSAGGAARALGVNPSTVQRRLIALEQAMGCPLVKRHAEGYRLTGVGTQLLVHAEQVEVSVDNLQRKVAALDHAGSGQVKLTSHVTVGQRIIKSGFLDAFHSRHPGIKVELIMDQRALDLAKGEADIAIRGGGADDGALVGKKITDLPWAIFASAGFVARHGRPTSYAELDKFSIIEFTDELAELPAGRWMKAHAPRARIAARCNNVPSVHLALRSGAGLAPLPSVYAASDEGLVNVFGAIPELDYPMFLFAHKEMRRLPRIKAVFEFCLRELKPVLTRGEMRGGR
jgi:DNA-binding transcriptional LysR family regulator